MSDSGFIRITGDDRAVFQDVLTSLESHRPAKSEKDILDKIREQFHLSNDMSEWPDILVSQGHSVESFLDFVLEQLSPFVKMVIELYRFFSQTVSTTGGRTTHFEVKAEELGQLLKFPNVDFPKKVTWIQSWAEVQIEEVAIDWNRIGSALIIDNGIFYGKVRTTRLIQSLIIARRDGQLPPALRAVGDQISRILRRCVRAWHARQRAENQAREDNAPQRWVERVFVPGLNDLMIQRGLIDTQGPEVGVDLGRLLASDSASYSLNEVFCDPPLKDPTTLEQEERRDWNLQAALFFITLWGLDEPSFQTVAGVLTAHESRPDLLYEPELSSLGPELAAELVTNLEEAIVPTGESSSSIQKVKKKLEILLLPYWRDRWFLYEVWTLCMPMIELLSMNGTVELLGIREIENPSVEGTTWNLPTQKAREPVAKLAGSISTDPLLLWFQRETRSAVEPRNIEPDVRITSSSAPFDDLMIIECKDRLRFSGPEAQRLARTYSDGTSAQIVWVTNFEDFSKKASAKADILKSGDREIGIAYSVKPDSGDAIVRQSIRGIIGSKLGLVAETVSKTDPGEYYLAIDVSGSMTGKTLPELPMFGETPHTPTRAYLWCQTVSEVDVGELEVGKRLPRLGSENVESGAALARLALQLPPNTKLIVVTDLEGKSAVENYLTQSDARYAFHPMDLEKHRVEFVIV